MKIHLITLLAIALTTTVSAQENTHYKTAADLFDSKQFDKALKEINLGLKKDSADIDLLILKGSTLKALKKRTEAVNVYTRMIDLYPED